MEIERKFTIKYLPKNLENYEKKIIEQGYLCTAPVVRIRKSNENYVLTYKSKIGLENVVSDICINNEYEMPLDKKSYEHLKQKCDGNIIEKIRYIIPIENNLKIELDVFKGYLKGLIFAEVEFKNEQQAKDFKLPEWFNKDVSNNIKYKNNYLASINNISELNL